MEKILFENLTTTERIEKLGIVKNGNYVRMAWFSYPKVKKEFNGRIRKESTSVLRIGLSYANLQENIGKEVGVRTEWVKKNVVYEDVDKNGVVSLKVRVFTSKCKTHKATTKWYLDGQPITKQELMDMNALSNSVAKPFDGTTFSIKLDNIISLG